MKYYSTRNKNIIKTASQAIYQGLSADGGLFIPQEIPHVTLEEIDKMQLKAYPQLACDILSKFIGDFSISEIKQCVDSAYGDNFDNKEIAPIHKVENNMFSLELWHGPTCAFKDMALQLLPYLLVKSKEKSGDNKTAIILVATSGDTGKAALEGFCNVDGTKIMVFYPENGVSPIQKLQMQTQIGENIGVCAVEGNFDDTQTGVKKIFSDSELNTIANDNGYVFSSANSINWGRLAPQIVYYFSAYAQLLKSNEIALGDEINFCVPTGNFGNILAAYYAKEMGLPIGKLICASNENNVLTDFINTGTYDRNREFHMTSSPSMDILISSNLERLIFHIANGDDNFVKNCFSKLSETGRYSVTNDIHHKIKDVFYADWCNQTQTAQTIKDTFEKNGYLIDTHTAVAFHVSKKYASDSGDIRPVVVVSTASPYKFANSVIKAIKPDMNTDDDFAVISSLESVSRTNAPIQLKSLADKHIRFTCTIAPCEMQSEVLKFVDKKTMQP